MPMRHQPARCARPAAASATQARNASASAITWSAANEPITASGSLRSSMRRGEADRGHRVARATARRSPGRPAGQLAADGVLVGGAGDDQHAVADQRREPVEGALHRVRPLPARSCRNFGDAGPRQRPQPRPCAAGRDDCPEPVECGVMASADHAQAWAATCQRYRAVMPGARTFPDLLAQPAPRATPPARS